MEFEGFEFELKNLKKLLAMSLEFRPFQTFSGHVQEVLLSYVVVLFAATRHSSPNPYLHTQIQKAVQWQNTLH